MASARLDCEQAEEGEHHGEKAGAVGHPGDADNVVGIEAEDCHCTYCDHPAEAGAQGDVVEKDERDDEDDDVADVEGGEAEAEGLVDDQIVELAERPPVDVRIFEADDLPHVLEGRLVGEIYEGDVIIAMEVVTDGLEINRRYDGEEQGEGEGMKANAGHYEAPPGLLVEKPGGAIARDGCAIAVNSPAKAALLEI